METTIVYWGYIGIMEKKMETTIIGYFSSNMVFRVWVLRLAAYEGSACQGVPRCSGISCWLMSIRDIKSVAPPADVLQKAGSCAAAQHIIDRAPYIRLRKVKQCMQQMGKRHHVADPNPKPTSSSQIILIVTAINCKLMST